MGRHLAVTRSSPDPCWVRFAIAAVQAVEVKWLILNTQQMFPFVPCEISLCQYVGKLVNQPRATLWVLETCLIVGLLPFKIILITLLRCLQTKLPDEKNWGLRKQNQHCPDHQSFHMRFLSFLECARYCTNLTLVRTQVSPCLLTLIRVFVKNCDDQIPHIKCGFSVQPQSCVRGNDFWFCWTVRNWSLFLTHPTDRKKCMTSKNAHCSTWCRFWIHKISCKIEVLTQSQSWQYCVSLMISGLLTGSPVRLSKRTPGRSPYHPKQTLCGVTFLRVHPLPTSPFQWPRSRTATLE